MIALELDGVSRDFTTPDGRGYRALDDISLSVEAGSFVAIVGPSGCGKSTLLNIVAGLLAPSAGAVHVEGEPLTGLNRRATYMFQQDALLPWKTVRENVALGLTLGGVARPDAHARADAWLTRVGLAPFAAHYPSQLSGGMRKRVVMAQNWIIDRGIELLVLWEGDSARGRESIAVSASTGSTGRGTQKLQLTPDPSGVSSRKTIIFVTHDLEEAIALADEVIVLSAGPAARIVARHPVALPRP